MTERVTVRPYVDDDLEPVYALRRLAFAGPRISPQWTVDPGGWYGFVAESGDGIAGFLRVREYAQFFGAAAVPMGGVASVAVRPYARGNGVAGSLLRAAITAMHERGQAISTLFASVPAVYRSHGWEHAGVRQRVTLSPEFLATAVRSGAGPPLRPATASDTDDMRARYREMARGVDGMLDRQGVTFPPEQPLSADVCELVPGRGYLTARRDTAPRLDVGDLVAADGQAAAALLRSLASWAGQVQEVDLPVVDRSVHDLVLGWPEQTTLRTRPWMLRVVDLPAAVAARGWPGAGLLRPAAAEVEIVDEQAPWHAGRFRLVVDGGGVRCEPGGAGTLRLGPRGLAAWFAGTATVAALRRAGLADGPDDGDTLLDQLTRAPTVPRLADDF